ncbi:MAG: hypothetical protein IJ661_02580 [Lachnospiraceae bacterium]|nr:hypothetical protein [Lachnospiraceae bacterium]
MRILTLPIAITILVAVLNHNINKNRDTDGKVTVSSFLKREENANSVRRKDISNLPYIHIPFESLPLDITLNDEKMQSKIEKYLKELEYLSDKQMLNLIGVTNTELKEQYGVANLDRLTTYDLNYGKALSNLQWYASAIYEEHPKEAVEIMEYMIKEGTDISTTYELLGTYYAGVNDRASFDRLFPRIPDRDSVSGKTILAKLNQILEDNPDF